MKILYATDLHGNREALLEALGCVPETGCEVILLGADILPKSGFEGDSISGQRKYISDFLRPTLEEFRTEHPDVPLYWMMGNDDWAANLDLLNELDGEGLASLVHEKAVRLTDNLNLVGYGFVPVTPFGIKDWDRFDIDGDAQPVLFSQPVMSGPEGQRNVDLEDDLRPLGTIEEGLAQLSGLSDPRQTVYMFHSPPFYTALDITSRRESVGSRAIRDFILNEQPPITLHGHIHESPEMSGSISEKLGKTLALNPGSSDRNLRAVVFDTDDAENTITNFGGGW